MLRSIIINDNNECKVVSILSLLTVQDLEIKFIAVLIFYCTGIITKIIDIKTSRILLIYCYQIISVGTYFSNIVVTEMTSHYTGRIKYFKNNISNMISDNFSQLNATIRLKNRIQNFACRAIITALNTLKLIKRFIHTTLHWINTSCYCVKLHLNSIVVTIWKC